MRDVLGARVVEDKPRVTAVLLHASKGAITHWFIGRAYCPDCEETATVVRSMDCDEVRCPQCDGIALLGWEAIDQ